MTKTFGFDQGRLVRNFISLVPLVAFPWALKTLGHVNESVILVFGLIAAGFGAWVLFTAMRFQLTVDEDGIWCRGRTRTREVKFNELESWEVRTGRGKPRGFFGPPPFKELVLRTRERTLVVSSLPLGEEAFDDLLDTLSQKLPADLGRDDSTHPA